MKRKKICILPQLNDCGGDVKKQWFVFYSYRNPADNNMKRFRVYDGFTDCYTKKAKYQHAEYLIKKYSDMLEPVGIHSKKIGKLFMKILCNIQQLQEYLIIPGLAIEHSTIIQTYFFQKLKEWPKKPITTM